MHNGTVRGQQQRTTERFQNLSLIQPSLTWEKARAPRFSSLARPRGRRLSGLRTGSVRSQERGEVSRQGEKPGASDFSCWICCLGLGDGLSQRTQDGPQAAGKTKPGEAVTPGQGRRPTALFPTPLPSHLRLTRLRTTMSSGDSEKSS